MSEPVFISPSRMGSFDKCGLAFQYDTELPRTGGGSVRGTGTGYHAGLELLYRCRMLQASEPTVDECVAAGFTAFDNDLNQTNPERYIWAEKVPNRATAHELVERMIRAYFDPENDAVWPSDWKVIGVELPFKITRDSIGFRGVIDLALQAPDGGIVGVDNKTNGSYGWKVGKESPRKQAQPPIYRAAMENLWPDAPYYRFVFDIMTYGVLSKKTGERSPCKFERRISDPSPLHVNATWSKALQIITLYNGMRAGGMDLPANTSSDLCSPQYCDHWDYCPHGAVLDTPLAA
jgi:hypothetical protein